MTNEEWLNKVYYKESNFVGVSELHRILKARNVNISRDEISKWLKKQGTSRITHTDVAESKVYLPIYSDIPHSFQIDLTFFPRYTKQNNGFQVLFTAININTRYVFAFALKDKTMSSILEAIKAMEKKTVINAFTSDYGGEFYNNQFREYCQQHEITNYFIKEDSHKLGIINRFHRTLKEKLTKYFYANDTVKWIDVIATIVYNYNRTYNRGIGATPFDVENNPILEMIILNEKKAVTGIVKDAKPEFEVNDTALLKRKDMLFADKMLPKYYDKRYKVIAVSANSVQIKDSKNKVMTVKKSQVIVANDLIVDDLQRKNRRLASFMPIQEQIKHRRIPKSDVDTTNIVEGVRNRKKKTYE
jgi:uncharacterized protein YehS (DUF1456 family)